ncbi:MAG TPA: cellulose biosynthesis protein BcsS [Steroidobacteraceae bacterium]
MKPGPCRTALTAAALAAALLTGAAANAQERLVLFGGDIAEAAYYSYFGTVLPFGRRENGRGWFQRYWVDAFGYEYEGGPGRIQADAYGLEAAVGYGGSSERGWWNTSVGLRYTDTSLEPDDPHASARGSQLGGKIQVEAEGRIAEAWRLGGIASYSNEQNGYWVRARLGHGATSARAFGVEAVANGNDEADATAVGLFTTFRPGAGSRWTIGLKAGYRFQEDADGAYGGVEFGYGF